MIGARELSEIVNHATQLEGVKKTGLVPGDCIVVTTKNSRYSIAVLGDGWYCVSGGWFEREGKGPTIVSISGCTWGGTVIKTDIVAGRGLCLEFGNRVRTTRIRDFEVHRALAQPDYTGFPQSTTACD